jgi:hypothetical protein
MSSLSRIDGEDAMSVGIAETSHVLSIMVLLHTRRIFARLS